MWGRNREKKWQSEKNWKLMAEFNFYFLSHRSPSDSVCGITTITMIFTEGRNDFTASRHFQHMLWLGAHKAHQGELAHAAREWVTHRSQICQQFRAEWRNVSVSFQHDYYNPSKLIDSEPFFMLPCISPHSQQCFTSPSTIFHWHKFLSFSSQCRRKDILWS